MRQSRGHLYLDRSHRHCDRCDPPMLAYTNNLETSDALEAEGWSYRYVHNRFYVSIILTAVSLFSCRTNLDRTIVTSIIRLLVLLPSLTTMDQTWVIGEGTLWM